MHHYANAVRWGKYLAWPALAAALAWPAALPATGQARDWPRFQTHSRARAGIGASGLGALRRQRVRLAGTVDSSPIYLHGIEAQGRRRDVFFATTTYGKTLAIDAADGRVLWTFTPPGYAGWAGSRRITNATPVAGPGRHSIYAAAPDGKVYKLAAADGHAAWSTAVTRLPRREKIASALQYSRGHIVVVTGGYIGDAPPYQGHVSILDAASGRRLRVWNSLCSNRPGLLNPSSCASSDSAIWGRAGATIEAQTGDLFIATGNGPWNGRTDWGDAVLWLNSGATRLLGNYTPKNSNHLAERDLDIGSSSPVLLGGGYLAQGGKDGYIRLLRLSQMRGGAAHSGGAAQRVRTPGGRMLFTALATLKTGGQTWLFAADNGGTAAWTLDHGRLQPRWQNAHAGTSPILAGGLLYIYDPNGGGLRVYLPQSGRQVGDLACGRGHWNSPIIVDGRIALPTGNANAHATSGELDIWRSK